MDPSAAQSMMPEIWPLVFKTGGALLVILGIIAAMFFAARRVTSFPGRQEEIRLVGARHLSPREKLILVEVCGKKILIGVTPGKIEKIETFEKDKDLEFKEQRDFSQELSQKMGGSQNKNDSDSNFQE